MAWVRTGFQLLYEDISAAPAMGSAAVVPWDSSIFGFPVASFRPGPGEFKHDQVGKFRQRFEAWMQARSISVCSSTLAPTQAFWRQMLPQAGFQFVDLSLQATLSLPGAKIPPTRFPLRLALPEDHAAIETIAAESFSHGRYHADPRFPRRLADRRYSQWVRNTLNNPSEIDRMYVLEKDGRVAGFYHGTIEGDVSDLRLVALATDLKGMKLGVELYAATFHELRRQGVQRVVTSISALNCAAVNACSMFGFRFSGPELVYHWHASKQQELSDCALNIPAAEGS